MIALTMMVAHHDRPSWWDRLWGRWPWRRRNGPHASPLIERDSARLLGKLDAMCEQLERQLRRDGDGGHGTG
jgi:hypothetical protein